MGACLLRQFKSKAQNRERKARGFCDESNHSARLSRVGPFHTSMVWTYGRICPIASIYGLKVEMTTG